jgi:hypothetical protein
MAQKTSAIILKIPMTTILRLFRSNIVTFTRLKSNIHPPSFKFVLEIEGEFYWISSQLNLETRNFNWFEIVNKFEVSKKLTNRSHCCNFAQTKKGKVAFILTI